MSSVPPSIPDGGEQLTGNKVRPSAPPTRHQHHKQHTTIGQRQHRAHNTTQHKLHTQTPTIHLKHREISPNHRGPSVLADPEPMESLVKPLYAERHPRSSGTELGSVLDRSSSCSLPGRRFLPHRLVTSLARRLFSVSLLTPVKATLCFEAIVSCCSAPTPLVTRDATPFHQRPPL